MKAFGGLALAIASAGALNWGFFAQHRAAEAMPRHSLGHPWRSLASLFGDRGWVTGFIVGLGGWAMYVVALLLAPLSIVQAASAGGIGLLAVLAARSGRAELTAGERLGVAVALPGLALLGVSLAGRTPGSQQAAWQAVALGLAASAAAAALAAGPVGRLLAAGAGHGIGSGLMYAAGDVATKAALASGARLAFVPVVAACHGAGFVLLQIGFQRGRVLETAGLSTLATNALPIAAGIALFHEAVPSGPLGILRVMSFVAVVGGAALLARSSAPVSAARSRRGQRERSLRTR